MLSFKTLKPITFLIVLLFFLNGCNGKIPGADARKYPADPAERIKKNMARGEGFRLMDMGGKRAGVFEFASSNELWRASLDTIDFMPLASVNYSGGVIVTDWYSTDQKSNESIKISIRFLSNEVRSDALDIKVFNRKCLDLSNCKISEKKGSLVQELKGKILKSAAIYEKEKKEKKEKKKD